MARIIQSKFPIDLTPSVAVGFGFPLNGNAVFVPTYNTRDQIKANMVNYLLTNRGERIFNPNFGTNLRTLLFENIEDTTIESLNNIIQDSLARYFPNVIIEELQFDKDTDNNTITFTLTYQIYNFGIKDSINIVLQ